MRVLHVLNTGQFSGAENIVCQIINMFESDNSYDMAYCSFDGSVRKALEDRRIAFYPIATMSTKEIKRVIANYHPDIIHAHDMKAGFVVAKACGKTPFISHIHNNAFDSRRISLKSLAYYLAAKKAKKIIWVSRSSFNGYIFHNKFKDKSAILYNVIDQEALLNRMAQDQKTYNYDVSYVGRISYPKNPQRLLQILRLTCDQLPELKVAIVGTGEEEDNVKEMCHKLELDNNVVFLGFKNNPLKILHDSKIMVMTSRWEGTPMVALEAIALGVPIISTPTDGMTELIDNGVNGYLTNDDQEFSKCIVQLIMDNSIRQKMIKSQQIMSKKVNDVNRYKDVLREIYGSILS